MGVLRRLVTVVACGASFLPASYLFAAEPLGGIRACRTDGYAATPVTAQAVPLSGTSTSAGVRRIAAQVRRNDKADMTFSSAATSDGALQVEGRSGDLSLRKTVRRDGGFALSMETPRDSITIELSAQSVTVSRGRKKVIVGDLQRIEDDLAEVQRLLSGSDVVRLSRTAAAAIESSEDDSPEAASLLMSDALIGALTGDPGAPGRVAQHLSRHVRAGIRRVAVGCYNSYETEVWGGWVDYESCLDSIAVYNPIRWGCSLRYLVMAESYWFEFMSCVGFSGLIG